MARVLIAGCGDVGTTLGRLLAARGDTVYGLRRSPLHAPGIAGIRADLTRPETLTGLPPALDQVVYAAAADGRDEAAYRAAYPDGLTHLVRALTDQGQAPARLVYVSSTGVYGQQDGEWVDEDSATTPAHFTGRCQLEAEAVLENAPWPGVALRFGGIYGPGRRMLIRRVEEGGTCREGLYTNRIHRDDCAGALAHVLAMEDPAPIYLGVDDEPAPQCRVMDWLAQRLGLPPPARETGGEVPAGKRCSNRRLRASGYRFTYPGFREGYGAVLDHQEH